MHYFGTDAAEARRRFMDPDGAHPGALVHWMRWREDKRRLALERGAAMSVADLHRAFTDNYHAEGRPQTARYFDKHLRRFLGVFGAMPCREVTEAGLLAFRQDLFALRLSPTTIGHDLGAIKTMWSFGMTYHRDQVPPLHLDGIRKPPRRPTPSKTRTPAEIRSLVSEARRACPQLAPWIALGYLCVLRPSETVRLVLGDGRFEPIDDGHGDPIPRGLFVTSSKMERKSHGERVIILTDQALLWLEQARAVWVTGTGRRGVWRTMPSYSAAMRRAVGVGPSVLRHSAASHLRALGVAEEEVDRLLGHAPRTASRFYGRASWRTLRASAARLSL